MLLMYRHMCYEINPPVCFPLTYAVYKNISGKNFKFKKKKVR